MSVESGAVAQGWSGAPWYVHCSDPPDCAPADEVYQQTLADAGRWLDGLGFGPPELAQVEGWPEGALHAAVSDAETINREKEPIGIYSRSTRRLYLSSEHFFAMGAPGQSHEDPAYSLAESLPLVPVHELFHAVQRGYQPANVPLWITEGTANAVLKAYQEQFQPELQVAPAFDRSYAIPLHKPPNESVAYATWRFWFELGQQLGSPAGIGYLHDVFNEDLSSNEGLDGVDRALPGGLATQLPRLFASWPITPFEPETHRAAPPQIPATNRFPLEVKEVAGKGAAVTVVVPGDEGALVHFSLEPGHPDLHLIVDGELHPQPVAAYEMAAGGDRTFNVVVVNVAGKASDSKPRNPTLKVMLLDGCNFLAEVSGDISGNFPGQVAYYNAFEDGQGVETGLAMGTGVDPGMHDQLQGLMGMAGNLAEMAERMGYQLDEDTKRKLQSAADQETQAVEEAKEWEQELLHSGTDTFGVTLQSAPHGGMAALLGAGFNMGISGEHSIPQGPGLAGAIDLQPSMVYAHGPLVDGNSEAVKFVWEPGEPGYVNATLTKPGELPIVYGVVNAELHAERSYDGRRPKINVKATFAALQGFESCMR
ncbi:MAG: hypothetical protein U5R46_17655 [Gammaproteobacteria bacterium]|nr:hypothetical protein [Gammaproteobacteria bacterium]